MISPLICLLRKHQYLLKLPDYLVKFCKAAHIVFEQTVGECGGFNDGIVSAGDIVDLSIGSIDIGINTVYRYDDLLDGSIELLR